MGRELAITWDQVMLCIGAQLCLEMSMPLDLGIAMHLDLHVDVTYIYV